MAKKKFESAESLLEKLEKDVGVECEYFFEVNPIARLSTGIAKMDNLLGGGWPISRIIEYYGIEGTFKTTVSYQTCGGVQKRFLEAKEAGEDVKTKDNPDAPGRAAFLDVEQKHDPYYAETTFGIIHPRKVKKRTEDNGFRLYRPTTAEDASNATIEFVKSGLFDIVVIDSAAAMCPEAEMDAPVGKQHMMLQAKVMTQLLRKLGPYVINSGCVVLFLNQSRECGKNFQGKPIYKAPGAMAFKHWAAMRLESWPSSAIKVGDDLVGRRVGVRIKKNQCGPEQYKSDTFRFYYGEGFCPYSEVLEQAIAFDVITKRGSWYAYKGDSIAQGWMALREWCKENEKSFYKIKAALANAEAEETDDQELSESQDDDIDLSF